MGTKAIGVALVTGASTIIGRAVARRLARDGFDVVAQCDGSDAQLDTLVSEIEAAGGRAIAIAADVTNLHDVQALFRNVEARLGGIDAVVHCDGFTSGDLQLFDDARGTDLHGTFFVLSHAAKHLFNGGRIVILLNSRNGRSIAGYAEYGLSVSGIETLVHGLATNVGRRNITVNALAPTLTCSPLSADDSRREQHGERIPLPIRPADQPEDIAKVISFLVGPEGAWVNGQVLHGTCAAAWSASGRSQSRWQ